MFNRVEPVFVIIDDFSAFGTNYGLDYTNGTVYHDGKNFNVSLFDYGAIDVQTAPGSSYQYFTGFPKFQNVTEIEQSVKTELSLVMDLKTQTSNCYRPILSADTQKTRFGLKQAYFMMTIFLLIKVVVGFFGPGEQL